VDVRPGPVVSWPPDRRRRGGTLALTGGVADKFGNLYEGRWTVACMAEVLADRWTSITLEPYDGFKIEFTGVCADGSA